MMNLRSAFIVPSLLACGFAFFACSDGSQELASPSGSTGDKGNTGQDNISVEHGGTGEGGAAGGIGPACASSTFEATRRPLDLYILLDQSGSMKENDDRWTPVSQAISEFIHSPKSEGINVAIQYFALGDTDDIKCETSTYLTPEVDLTALPEGSEALDASLAAHDFPAEDCCTNDNEHKGTPTRPAVEGALSYLGDYVATRPDHVAALLLATDGAPTANCSDNSVADVAQVIQDAAESEDNIVTYVIGIGEEDSLSEMAEAGGTGDGPFLVDGSGDQTENEFALALETIRGQAIPCDYDFPKGTATDPFKVNLSYMPPGSKEAATAIFVEDASECDPAVDQWFYEVTNEERRIQLCPRLCSTVSQSSGGSVDIVVGCATRVR